VSHGSGTSTRFASKFRRLHEPAAAAATATARCSGAKLFAAVMAMNRPHCDRERIRQVGTVDVDMRSRGEGNPNHQRLLLQ
jgi:hypothetical protein